ncbi:MAG: CapA family protein [Armatimonadota bacterium]
MPNRLHTSVRIVLLTALIALLSHGIVAQQPATQRITVAAVGDLLMHLTITDSAYNKQAGAYDFTPVFAPIAPYLRAPDLTIANLETRLAGPELGYSGYPCFNTPAQLARVLKNAGVDLLATANNHSMDKGWAGVVNTLNNLDTIGLPHIGTARSAAEQAAPYLVSKNGITLGILNYTEMTNGIPLPAGKSYAVNILSTRAVIAQAAAARKAGADLVIAVLHFGVEYQRAPNDAQRRMAHTLLGNEVDVVIGAHPHVVQPIGTVTGQRDGQPVTRVIAYSLGNFISNQRDRYRDSGMILYLDIEKSAAGATVIGIRYLPVWVQKGVARGITQFRVIPVHPEIQPAIDLPLTTADRARMKQVWEELTAHVAKPAQGINPYMPPAKANEFLVYP